MKLFSFKHNTNAVSSTRGSRSIISRIGRDPHVDWTLCLVSSVIVTAVLVSVSVIKYSSFDSNLQRQVSAIKSKSADVIDTKSLDIVIQRFEDRATLRTKVMNGYSGPRDPSI